MVFFSEKEIEFIKSDLRKKGITMPGLDHDLLDHLLCAVEQYMDSGYAFAKAYELAFYDLCKDREVKAIQLETTLAMKDRKRFLKNLIIYSAIIGLLITVFNVFTTGINPALILTCISLAIFFIYHSVFCVRKSKSKRNNLILFIVITLVPVVGVMLFLAKEFPQFRLIGTPGWCMLIILLAIPVYYGAVRRFLRTDSTVISFVTQTLNFTATIGLIWVPLASYIKLFRPENNILFFLDDFLLLSISCFALSMGLQKFSDVRLYLRNVFKA